MPLPTEKSEKEVNHLKKKYLIYGIPKSGKTTFSANFGDDNNKTLFFCTEPGHSFVEIFKWHREDGGQPQNWNDFIDCCRELYKGDHDFSLLCVDTVDILWNWCTDHFCKMNDITHPSEMGFGKAYQGIAKEFSNVCNMLGQKGVGFIFISHPKEYEVKVGPRQETRTTTTLSSGAQKFIHGFVDYIWFFNKNEETDERYILTDRHEGIMAGSRGDINDEPLPLKMKMNPFVVKKKLNEKKKLESPFWFDEEEEIEI